MTFLTLSKTSRDLLTAYIRGYRATEEGEVINPKGNTLKRRCKTAYITFKPSLRGRKSVPIQVHRLAALDLFGPQILYNRKIVVRHLDGNSHNNNWSNLATGSAKDNCMDRPPEQRKAHSLRAASFNRIHDQKASEIRETYATGSSSYKDLSEKYGIGKSMLSYILSKTAKRKAQY